jgi:tetratricopeptide (TPR) repeat protein
MSRFSNLEFGNEYQDPGAPKGLLKGEAHFLAEARNAFENGEFETGLRLYSRVLEYNALNVGAWAGQVRMLIELGEFKEARLWADKALERFPHEPELLAAKAVALARTGAMEEALACSDASIEERGDTPYVWLARGDVLLARREARADYCFDKALLLAPRDWFITWLAARIRFYYDQFALALKLTQQAVELNAGHFVLWLELGRCQQAVGLLNAARTSYTQAQELKPDCRTAKAALIELSGSSLGQRLRGLWRRLRG